MGARHNAFVYAFCEICKKSLVIKEEAYRHCDRIQVFVDAENVQNDPLLLECLMKANEDSIKAKKLLIVSIIADQKLNERMVRKDSYKRAISLSSQSPG